MVDEEQTKTKSKVMKKTNWILLRAVEAVLIAVFLIPTIVSVSVIGNARRTQPIVIVPQQIMSQGKITSTFTLPGDIEDKDAAELFLLTNKDRGENGLAPLTYNTKLEAAARAKANDELAKQYFAHKSPDGKEFNAWVREAGYVHKDVGENLAVGFNTMQDVEKAFMASPTHRANILNEWYPYKEIGIAIVHGKYQKDYGDLSVTFVVVYFANTSR